MQSTRSDKPVVLLFCRPYLVEDFRANFAPFSEKYDFRHLTDGRWPGTDDTREAFYRHMKAGSVSQILTDADRVDIIRRCRLLRNLPERRAAMLAEAMACALGEWFDHIEPQLVVCHMVDEYVTHLVSLLARKRGIRYIGYAYSFFPDLIQVTEFENGQPLNIREPSPDEVQAVIDRLTQGYFRQDYGQRTNYSRKQHVLGLFRYRVKQGVFWAKALRDRDPWNVHYAITPYIVERRRLTDYPSETDFDVDWKQRISSGREGNKGVTYLPLGYFPESTIDYWTPNSAIIDYESMIVKMARSLAADFIVVIKEHPHMLGARDRAFYDRLRSIDGVVLVHALAYSSEVMRLSDCVVLGAGSGGVEAVLTDKPVFSYVDTSYWFAASGATYLDLDDIDSWPEQIRALITAHVPLEAKEKAAFIAHCLASTIRQRPGKKRWPHCDLADLDRLLSLGLHGVEPLGGCADPVR